MNIKRKVRIYSGQLIYFYRKSPIAMFREIIRIITGILFIREDYFVLRRDLAYLEGIKINRDDVSFVELTMDDINIFEKMVPPLHLEFLKLRFQLGERCLGLKYKGEIAAWSFWSSEPQIVMRGVYRLREGEYTASESYTDEKWRRKGFGSLIQMYRDILAYESGFFSAIIIVRKNNKPSLGMHKKLKGVIVGEFIYLRVLRFERRSLKMNKDVG